MSGGSMEHAARSVLTPSAICMLLVFAGCATTEAIPSYPPMTASRALARLADRARAIKSVSAQALVTLTHDNNETVRLDAAVVLKPPDSARLRAYKFGQAVFDMTLTPDGLWLLASHGEHRDQSLSAGMQSGQLTREWLHLMTRFFEEPNEIGDNHGSRLVVEQSRSGGTKVVCQVDRKTLTVRSYTLLARDGRTLFTLKLADYSEIGGTVWPGRIEAVSEAGQILIQLRDIEINGELPATALRPPLRAEKLP